MRNSSMRSWFKALRNNKSGVRVAVHIDTHFSYIVLSYSSGQIQLCRRIAHKKYYNDLHEHIDKHFNGAVDAISDILVNYRIACHRVCIHTVLPAPLVMRHVLPAVPLSNNALENYVYMQVERLMPGYDGHTTDALAVDYTQHGDNKLEIMVCEKQIIDKMHRICRQHALKLSLVSVDVSVMADRFLVNFTDKSSQNFSGVLYFGNGRIWLISLANDGLYRYDECLSGEQAENLSVEDLYSAIALDCQPLANGHEQVQVLLAGNWADYGMLPEQLAHEVRQALQGHWDFVPWHRLSEMEAYDFSHDALAMSVGLLQG